MRVRMFLQDAAWLGALAAIGLAVILIDVRIGLPALLDVLAGRPL